MKDEKKKGWYDWAGIKYLLFEYEEFLSGSDDKISKWDDCEIEFIYPEDKVLRTKGWGNFQSLSELRKNHSCYSLGNLLLLSRKRKYNDVRRLTSFALKKEGYLCPKRGNIGYQYGSYSEKEIIEYDDWGRQEIKDRGIKLLRFIEDRYDVQLSSKYEQLTGINFSDKEEKQTSDKSENS